MTSAETSKEQVERLKEQVKKEARNYYSEELEYHNFEHALQMLEYAEEIMRNCEKEGVSFDAEAVVLGALCHDGGYHEDHSDEFETKEDYSANLAGLIGKELGINPRSIAKSQVGIRGTNPFISVEEVENLSVEGKILRAADVAGMMKPFDEFMIDNANLKMEDERMNNKKLTWDEWKNKSGKVIEKYLEGKIELTGESHRDGKSRFHEKVRANSEKFMSASDDELDTYLKESPDDYVAKAA